MEKFFSINIKTSTLAKKVILIIITVIAMHSCANEEIDEPYLSEYQPNLEEVFRNASQIVNIRSLVVYKNGKLIRQEFFSDADAYAVHDVRSVTMSITSLLVGIALDKGYLKSIDQTLQEFSIPAKDSVPYRIGRLRIRDLLTMSAGFEWDELESIYNFNWWMKSSNQIQYLLEKQIISDPGKYFNYNSASYHLLSVILTKAAKMNASEFANRYLFEPLGISDREWERDQQGFNYGSTGLKMSPDDMIKIGELILNKGKVNGKQIVPADWIESSISQKISTNNSIPFGFNYGYGWFSGKTYLRNYVFASGYGGQFIVIAPEINLVVSATNKWSGVKYSMINDQWIRTIRLIIENIIPSCE